jgi:hypothetical protein
MDTIKKLKAKLAVSRTLNIALVAIAAIGIAWAAPTVFTSLKTTGNTEVGGNLAVTGSSALTGTVSLSGRFGVHAVADPNATLAPTAIGQVVFRSAANAYNLCVSTAASAQSWAVVGSTSTRC